MLQLCMLHVTVTIHVTVMQLCMHLFIRKDIYATMHASVYKKGPACIHYTNETREQYLVKCMVSITCSFAYILNVHILNVLTYFECAHIYSVNIQRNIKCTVCNDGISIHCFWTELLRSCVSSSVFSPQTGGRSQESQVEWLLKLHATYILNRKYQGLNLYHWAKQTLYHGAKTPDSNWFNQTLLHKGDTLWFHNRV